MFSTLFGTKKKLISTVTVELSPESENAWKNLHVKIHNGRIALRQWENDHVQAKVEVTVSGKLADDLKEQDTDRFWELEEQGATVSFEQQKLMHMPLNSSVRVNVELMVPKHLNTDVTTHNGAIQMEETSGQLAAETHNGEVSIARHQGDARLHSHNGKIIVDTLKGDLEVSTHNGALHFTSIEGAIKGETKNGKIHVENCHDNMELATHNGKIQLENKAATTGDWEMTTHNGSIVLTLPKEVNANFKLRTHAGKIKGDLFNVQLSGISQKLQAQLGDGGAEIRLSTSRGSIELNAPV